MDVPSLVGRADELSSLQMSVGQASDGYGGLALIDGEAGIGKSRLVGELSAHAERRGVKPAVGSADELERRRPFAALATALGLDRDADDPQAAAVGQMLAGEDGTTVLSDGPSADAAVFEFRVSEAIVDLVDQWSAEDPLLIVIEDLHWADAATLTTLGQLGRMAAQRSLLIVGTTRRVPRSDDLSRLIDTYRDLDSLWISLEPLDTTGISDIAEQMTGAKPTARLRRELEGAGGNPLFAIELVRALQASGAIDHVGGRAETGAAAATSPSVALSETLRLVPERAFEVLRTASVLGASFDVTDLGMLRKRPISELAGPLADAIAAGVLAESEQRLVFRHELLRTTLYEDISEPVRRALHREAAETFATAGRPAELVAEHLLRCAGPGDSRVVQLLRDTAGELAGRAPAVAVELLDRALTLIGPADPDETSLALRRIQALLRAGRHDEGEAACRELLHAVPDTRDAALVRRTLVKSLAARGRAAESVRAADEALRMPDLTDVDRADYVASKAFALTAMGELDSAVSAGEEAVGLATASGDDISIAEARIASAQALSVAGRVTDAAERAVQAAFALEQQHQDVVRPQFGHATAGTLLVFAGHVDRGRAHIERGYRLNEQIGARSALAAYHVARGAALFTTGEWDDAITELEATAGLERDGLAWPLLSHGVLASISVHRDDLDDARRQIIAAEHALGAGAPPHKQERLALARAVLLDATGETGAALDQLRRTWDDMTSMGARMAQPVLGPELTRRLVAAGDSAAAADVASALESCADINADAPSILGAARISHAVAHRDSDAAVAGIAAYEQGRQSLDLGLAYEDAASVLADAEHREQAIAMLDRANGIYRRLNAVRRMAHVAARHRRLGVRRGRPGTRKRPTTGWEALTPSERRVAELLAERLSNREIADRLVVSRRTVETHVSRALTKLGLSSRREIITHASRSISP